MARKPCEWCGLDTHYSYQCFRAPKKPIKTRGAYIKHESDKSRSKRLKTAQEWHESNPPDINGNWICYLQISPQCPVLLTNETLVLEHVKSKTRAPELKYVVTNLRPACGFCNEIKGSQDGDVLVDNSID